MDNEIKKPLWTTADKPHLNVDFNKDLYSV